MATKSRLTSRIESQTKRNVVITLIGIVIIVSVLFKFGVPFLATASFMLAGGKQEEQVVQKPGYIAPPTLHETFSATNSASVSLSGSSISKTDIELFVNNTKQDIVKTDADKSFTFEGVRLKKGENAIRVRAITENGEESDSSNTIYITYLDNPPTLSIENPTDGSEFKKDDKTANISGKTDVGVKITVNDFWAIVNDEGNYSYTLPLKEGDNDIKVIATDEAGNKVEKSIRVKYSP